MADSFSGLGAPNSRIDSEKKRAPRNNGVVSRSTEAGKVARKRRPRSSFGNWEPSPTRRNPVDILVEQGKSRVAELLPIRYGRMSESPFAFFRGAAAVMAADIGLATTTGITAQLCGDAHLSNFGIFAAPSRTLVFDCNDFDETIPGPWEWDVMRLCASLAIAGRSLNFSERQRNAILTNAVVSYRDSVHKFAAMSSLDVWYAHLNADYALARWAKKGKKKARIASKITAKAHSKDSLRAFSKMAEVSDGTAHFRNQPPLLVPAEELMRGSGTDIRPGLAKTLKRYRKTLAHDRRHLFDAYEVVDAARRVVGVGSVGTVAWIALLLGPGHNDPLILQFKEASASVLEPYTEKNQFNSQGRRVVEGQRLMQAHSDVLLGWERMDGPWEGERDFYVRQLWDGKYSADVDNMSAGDLREYAGFCAWTLARAHCRSGDRFALASYVGNGTVLDHSLATFAEKYADKNEADFAELTKAIASGRVVAETGV